MQKLRQYKFVSLTLLGLLGAGLTGCATYEPINQETAEFGTSTAHNRAVHAVAPTADQKNDTYIPADANRQTIAREKYRNNTVTNPVPISTR